MTPGSPVEENLKSLTETRTAGDPDDERIVFTDLTPTRLEEELTALGTPASDDLIRRWMDEQNLRLRKIRKVIPGGESPDRDAQFVNIARLIEQYESAGNPYFFIDTKAKEFLGQLGHGGIAFIAELLGCSIRTIRRGMDELDQLPHDPAAGRVRRPGAGRKKR